jgi:hypothetical protein
VAQAADGRIAVVDGLRLHTALRRLLGKAFALPLKAFASRLQHPLHGKNEMMGQFR